MALDLFKIWGSYPQEVAQSKHSRACGFRVNFKSLRVVLLRDCGVFKAVGMKGDELEKYRVKPDC